jgi:hypothetical protein
MDHVNVNEWSHWGEMPRTWVERNNSARIRLSEPPRVLVSYSLAAGIQGRYAEEACVGFAAVGSVDMYEETDD